MSYRIVFKGGLPDEFVEEVRGAALANAWEKGHLTGIVKINENIYDAKSIKAIMSSFANPDKKDEKERHIKEMLKMREEFNSYRENLMKLTPAERAKFTGLAELVWFAIKGRKMNSDEKQDVIEKSTRWLTEHPDFHLANPVAYMRREELFVKSNTGHIGDILKQRVLALVERVLMA